MMQMLGKIPAYYIFYDLTPFYIQNKKHAYSNTPPLLLFRVTNEPTSRVGVRGGGQGWTNPSQTRHLLLL
jgi:hypothetical protein